MPNLVIQQIKIADYKNTFLMPNTSNCRLQITNGPSDKINENFLVSEQKVVFDRNWTLKLLSAHSEFLIYG